MTANARLIAAAPEMLACLREIVRDAPETEPEYDSWGGDTERAERWGGDWEHWRLAELARVVLAGVKSRFVCKSGGSSSPSARLLGRPPVSGGVRGRGNAGRPRRVWS